MAILSTVGRRSWGMRLCIWALYLMLTLGAVTMVYPLLLMLATSATSQVDVDEYRVLPRYFYDDDILFAKFAEEKYATTDAANDAYGTELYEFRELIPLIARQRKSFGVNVRRIGDWREFVKTLPPGYKTAAFLSIPGLTGKSHLQYRRFIEEKFQGNLARCREAYREDAPRFQAIEPPVERSLWRDYAPELTAKYKDFLEFKRTLPEESLAAAGLDAKYAGFLQRRFDNKIEALNAACDSHFGSFAEAHLPECAPEQSAARAAWLDFVVQKLPLSFVGVKDGCHWLARQFLGAPPSRRQETMAGETPALPGTAQPVAPSDAWERNVRPGVDRPKLEALGESAPAFYEFIKREARTAPENIFVLSTENLYRERLKQKYGTLEALNQAQGLNCATWLEIAPPVLESDWDSLQASRGQARWHYATRNYAEVLGYILLHGRAVWNTFVLVILTLFTSLTVNPLAAYALSRFQLSYANKILLFCLATMAFPPEVAMIPSFLLLRSFPLAQLVTGLVMGLLALAIYLLIFKRRGPVWLGVSLSILLGVLASQAIPSEAGRVPLLNSYSALILPGVANGFAIFMFKGFFDTLPKELYEAAALEGASELRMFFQITVPLCAPVIAVIGLGTFAEAYGSFMWAFLVCQKEEMWTLMVWLYEMQQWAPVSVLIAALALAAIPTLLAFLLCQRFILRGMVLPSLH